MNEVEHILTEAQRKYRKRLLVGSATATSIIGLVVLVYLATLLIGRLTVVVAPTEAASTAQIEVLEGIGFVAGSNIWGLKRQLNMVVTADGYEAEELSITLATWKRGKVDVVMREVLATLQATAVPKLPDLQWYLNDAFITKGASLETRMNSGEYSVSARHPYYVSTTQNLTAEKGKNYRLELKLDPVKGEIFITSIPDGATVMTESEIVGQTPLNLEVEGGIHDLTVTSDGFDSQIDSVRITASSPAVKRHYELARSVASVSLSLSPTGGMLLLDGKVKSVSDNKLILPVDTHHKLEYSKDGFRSQSVDLTVKRQGGNTVRIDLSPVYGLVEVDSEPQTEIEINGKVFGQTPQLLKMHAVSQTITLSAPRYLSQTRTILPQESTRQSVFMTLESEKDYRMRNAQPRYVNSAGGEMKLFDNLGSITLGSPRGEIGRRANEFLREVRLTRPFYAGVHEVTVEQFEKYSAPGQASSANRQPVTGIGWTTAAKFCNWLSNNEGITPVYLFTNNQFAGSNPSADGYRMLTEAEWEWLARKAGRTQQSKFPWGDTTKIPVNSGNFADESAKGSLKKYIANYRDGYPQVSDTGMFNTNPAGLHDLAGNVKEWTHDLYSLKPPEQVQIGVDALDSGKSARHTIKGSSWKSAELTELRASWRGGSDSASDDVGFRVARYLF